jgi:hypothetical protein
MAINPDQKELEVLIDEVRVENGIVTLYSNGKVIATVNSNYESVRLTGLVGKLVLRPV